ncbi:PAS domain-containing protein [Fibrobacter sp. UWH3]|uniref:PAS domain-containing protein n=1 Tax=Fibrobacter sp. UWH3 TaxID=1964353 RepID=UPI000B51EA74|nr:PAS domain-containing protein [Fibrobacter sp. UWH3]OWV05380.1 hypothetical protein B7993_08920 [Fibrobacter sp. UWH3]
MIDERKGSVEQAYFEANRHGRLIKANKRFCRMFGFEEGEIEWHYVTDLCRNAKDWENYVNSQMLPSTVLRMKNRKGRSFCCKLFTRLRQDGDGELRYDVSVHRVSATSPVVAAPAAFVESRVFLARCAHCGSQIRVESANEVRFRRVCDQCAAREYPEAYAIRCAQV